VKIILSLKLSKIVRFVRSRSGANALEYGLIIGLIAVGLITVISSVGSGLTRISCGVSRVVGTIAFSSFKDGGSANPCNTGPDTCTGAPVGSICQRLNANGGYDTVVVAQTNTLYAWPSDEPGTLSWNNNTGNWVQVFGGGGTPGTGTEYPSSATADMAGMSETNTLVGLTGAAAPYQAATACRAHGPDWYLPAYGELNIITSAAGGSGVGSLVMNTSGSGVPYNGIYWSASEGASNGAWIQWYLNGWLSAKGGKSSLYATRCVRK
jgi:pilus assembly protein Flp/PilA